MMCLFVTFGINKKKHLNRNIKAYGVNVKQKYPEKLAVCGFSWPAGCTQTCGVHTVENMFLAQMFICMFLFFLSN